jgi:hypothetical protein
MNSREDMLGFGKTHSALPVSGFHPAAGPETALKPD